MKKSQLIFDKTVGTVFFYGFNLLNKLSKKNKFFGRYIDLQKNTFKRILVIRPGGIGDALVAMPFFRRLAENFKEAEVDVICSKRNADIIKELPYFRKVFVLDNYRKTWNLLKNLIFNHYEIVFDLDQVRYIAPILSYITRAPIRVGFDTKKRRNLYTHIINYQQEHYEAENFLRQLLPFGVPIDFLNEQLEFPVKSKYFERAKQQLDEVGINEDTHIVMINIGGLNRQNCLRSEEYIKLIPMILSIDDNIKIIFTGDKKDAVRVKQILHCLKTSRVADFSGKTTIMESMALMKLSYLFIGHDGGPLHMAVSSGCRTVSIWGPSLFNKWAPRGINHRAVKRDLFCQPCVYGRFPEFPGCPYDMACMQIISADDIFKEVKIIIKGSVPLSKERNILCSYL